MCQSFLCPICINSPLDNLSDPSLPQVFLSAEPKHWCHQPGLEDVAPDLNWTQRVHLGSPLEREDGDYRLYSRCSMYNVSWPDLLQVTQYVKKSETVLCRIVLLLWSGACVLLHSDHGPRLDNKFLTDA